MPNLPEGVSEAEWADERTRWQNPRIRCFLGCIRVLDEVMESNFSILHCSPTRLRRIWSEVRAVAVTIRGELTPLVHTTSVLPEIEHALYDAQMRLSVLELGVLSEIDRYPEDPADDQLQAVRIQLCSTMGKLHAFLNDTLGQLLASDPRSQGDFDYFLSRKFARDVDEAEWLEECVAKLDTYLRRLNAQRPAQLTSAADQIADTRRLPSEESWKDLALFLDELSSRLTPMLKRTIGLRGIRIDELETVQKFSTEIPIQCQLLRELYRTASTSLERLESSATRARDRAAAHLHAALGWRLVHRIRVLDNNLRDLVAFVPLWRAAIGQRRALMLGKKSRGDRD
jgi:hypothetical protein